MSQRPQYRERFRSPELFLSELLKKGAQGKFHERDENVPFLYRASVSAVDVLGGQLENPSGNGSVVHTIDGKDMSFSANVGPVNPRNSVKARIISDGFDQFIADDRLCVFWPFFPEHVSVPVKPGEHVYVMFEDADFQHGLWITKVPGQENLNFFRGQDAFSMNPENPLSEKFSDTKATQGEEHSDDRSAGESVIPNDRLSSLDF